MIIQAKEEHFEDKGMLVKGKKKKKAKLEARFMTSMCRSDGHKSTCKFIQLQTCKSFIGREIFTRASRESNKNMTFHKLSLK